MIKLHFHTIDFVQYCHLYSDTGNIEELKEWLKDKGKRNYNKWIQKDKIPHIDLFGEGLFLVCTHRVAKNREFHEDMENYRQEQQRKNQLSLTKKQTK